MVNTTTFDEVKTTKLRLEMVSKPGNSTGLVRMEGPMVRQVAGFPAVVHWWDRDMVWVKEASVRRRGALPDVKADRTEPQDLAVVRMPARSERQRIFQAGDYVLKLSASQRRLEFDAEVNVVEPP